MPDKPVICFGQQPCGFFPKRFLVAKILTARRLAGEIGGQIVFFYHDSDHDPRETRTILRHRKLGEPAQFNFQFENKLQRKYTPFHLKRVCRDWQARTALQLPAYVERQWARVFAENPAGDIAAFCLEMYRQLGMLEQIQIVRSSDPDVRRSACAVTDYYVDVPLGGEIVRTRWQAGSLVLHEGGDSYRTVPHGPFGPEQISPTRDSRLRWMQSVIHCTHYVAGAGEQAYLSRSDAPEIIYVNRDPIERSDEAWTEPI